MRLTNKAREELRRSLADMERGLAFLKSERNAFCRREEHATTTLHYTRADGAVLHEMNRDCGSELQLLEHGAERLAAFLATH